jgi:hypothetical protein
MMDLPEKYVSITGQSVLYHASRHTLGLVGEETVDLRNGSVVCDNSEAVVGGVKDQVLAHDSQTDEAEITTRDTLRRSADIDAGQTGAEVSNMIMSMKASQMHRTGERE